MKKKLGQKVSMDEVKQKLVKNFEIVFDAEIIKQDGNSTLAKKEELTNSSV